MNPLVLGSSPSGPTNSTRHGAPWCLCLNRISSNYRVFGVTDHRAVPLRYHTNAITTAQVLEELIKLAKDIRAARARGEESGLSDEEIAFYDALAENDSARQAMGEPALRLIAHELVMVIKTNMTIDWIHRAPARAKIRVHVKRLLKKYGYPPDLQDSAVQNVLRQAEALSTELTR